MYEVSIFRNLAASARAAHAHYFSAGSNATIVRSPGSAAQPVNVILGEETVDTRREGNSDVRYYVRECRFVALTSVRHDAVITITTPGGDLRYSIDQFIDRQASGLTVKLKRCDVIDTNRSSYRS